MTQVVPNAVASGSLYKGNGGLAYVWWHLARHVKHGSLSIPRSSLLLSNEGNPQSDQVPLNSSEILDVALNACDRALAVTQSDAALHFTFLMGHSGPLSLKCAILTDSEHFKVRPVPLQCM
jgi:hypothetical protein